ncbi:MAG: TonB-dependent receptor plug domain-containing protein [Spirochaetes bacterium]|nr:TonB-dependent receptor plug domain-containing protein [Spirochaetota bacterium]
MKAAALLVALSLLSHRAIYGESNEGRRFTIRLTGERNWKDTTLTIAGTGYVLVPDAQGVLQDPLNENQPFLTLTNGEYRAEIIRPSGTVRSDFRVDGGTPAEISLAVSSGKAGPAEQQRRMEALTVSGLEARKEYARSVITAEDSRLMPGSGGDVVRSVVNQPGVVKTTTYASGMFIRGGELEDLLYTYDAIRVGNPFHIVGVHSAFPPLSIESLNFYSGVPPLRFGTSLAAVEVLSKTRYDKKQVRADIDVNLAAAGFYVSIPIGPKLQVSFGARRTYYELYYSVLKSFPTIASLGGGLLTTFSTIPFFYDLNAKLDWNIDAANTLSVVFVNSMDQALFDTSLFPRTNAFGSNLTLSGEKLGFENWWNTVGVVWSHDTKNFRSKLTLSRYYNSNSFADFEQAIGLPTLPGSVDNYAVAENAFWRPSDKVALELGAEAAYETFPFTLRSYVPNTQVGLLENLANMSADSNLTPTRPERVRASAFAGAEIATGSFLWNFGARAGWNSASGSVDVDPRAGITFQPKEETAVYLRGGRFSALPLLIQIAPVYSNRGLRSPYTWQAVLGGQWKIGPVDFKAESYYIRFMDQILIPPSRPQGFTNTGDGTSYGAELFVKKNLTKEGLVGWLSYAWNKSDRTFYDDSKNLVWGTFRREVPHSVSLILAQGIRLGEKSKLLVGTRLAWSVGRPYTGQSIQKDASGRLLFVEDSLKSQERLPNRFTWDMKISWDFRMFGTGEGSLYLDFWNMEGLFGLQNATYPNYDAGMVNPANTRLYDASLKAGDRAPVQFIYDLPPMPILGFKLTF